MKKKSVKWLSPLLFVCFTCLFSCNQTIDNLEEEDSNKEINTEESINNPGPAEEDMDEEELDEVTFDYFNSYDSDIRLLDGEFPKVGYGFDIETNKQYGIPFKDFEVSSSEGSRFASLKVFVAESFYDDELSFLRGSDYFEVSDVNGDGRADVIAFGIDDTFVAIANSNGTFRSPIKASNTFATNDGWKNSLRLVADVDGDSRADIIAFGNNDTFVAFSK